MVLPVVASLVDQDNGNELRSLLVFQWQTLSLRCLLQDEAKEAQQPREKACLLDLYTIRKGKTTLLPQSK